MRHGLTCVMTHVVCFAEQRPARRVKMAEAAAGAPAEAAELTTQWEALQLQQRHAEQLLQRQATLLERAGNGAKPAAGEVGDADAARETLRSQRAAVDGCIAVKAAARIS